MAGRGEFLGPLHGIPIGLKDIVDVEGWPTEAGSPLLKGQVAEKDAPLAAQLRANGAIVLGKTVTTEFAFLDPGPTRNPWQLDHTPGGSSSGSAAAVALEMCMAAVGSQTGGSIIRPASYCGVAGLKPTFGKVDTTGVVPVSRHLDHVGPIARTAGDLSVMLSAMTGPCGSPEPAAPTVEPPVLHVIDDFFTHLADPVVREVTRNACDRLQGAGAELRIMNLPASFAVVRVMHSLIMAVDAAETHRATFSRHAGSYGPLISALIEEGLSSPAVDYATALRHQMAFRSEMETIFRDGVIALTPATVTPAPAGWESTGDPGCNSPWSYAGLPTATIPCGLTDDGLPCGLQLIGPRDGDRQLLSVAAWCAQVLAFQEVPPLLLEGI
jgi:aspartyl-tRNA(Asn)/glutamyl-tRNA(Gln) amidotransferase subunit A